MNSLKYKKNIWKIYIFEFFLSLFFVDIVIIPFYTEWGRITFTQIMVLQSWFMICGVIFDIPSGTIADYMGRKNTLILGVGINILAVFVYTSISNYYIFMIGELLWALSRSLNDGTSEAFIYDTLKQINQTEKSKKAFSRFRTFSLIGAIVSAPIGSIIAYFYGPRATMFLLWIPFSIAFIIGLTFKEPQVKKSNEKIKYKKMLKKSLKYFFNNQNLKILAINLIFMGTIYYLIFWLYQPMLMQANVNILYFGFIYIGMVLFEILIINNFKLFEKIFRLKRFYLIFCSIITGIMFIIGGFTTFFPIVIMVLIIGNAFNSAKQPILITYINKQIQSSERATVISTITMLNKLVIVIVNPVIGLLVEFWSLNNTLILLGVIMIIFSLISRVREKHLIDYDSGI
ncbi:MAG: MFS transporter [Candidatus Helarchaeota archaeon]